MSTLLTRSGRYLAALVNETLNRLADPRLQVGMAVEESRRRHQLLTEQAGAVLGNQRELEIKVGRALAEMERLRSAARQALVLVDRARRNGDAAAADAHERTAGLLATQLAAAESVAAELAEARDRAGKAAEAARQAVERSAYLLQISLSDASRLLTEIETARMQERVADALAGLDGAAPTGADPTLGEIRSRVDRRIALAAARAELAGSGPAARMLEIERAGLEEAGRQKLDGIRRAVGLPAPVTASNGGVEERGG